MGNRYSIDKAIAPPGWSIDKALDPPPAGEVAFEMGRAGMRVCKICGDLLSSEMLMAQAQELMAPFVGRKIDADLDAQIGELLQRAALPLNEGVPVCYFCADYMSRRGLFAAAGIDGVQ